MSLWVVSIPRIGGNDSARFFHWVQQTKTANSSCSVDLWVFAGVFLPSMFTRPNFQKNPVPALMSFTCVWSLLTARLCLNWPSDDPSFNKSWGTPAWMKSSSKICNGFSATLPVQSKTLKDSFIGHGYVVDVYHWGRWCGCCLLFCCLLFVILLPLYLHWADDVVSKHLCL